MLTKQQQKLLKFIYDEMYENGVCPSYDEMRDALGLKSKSGIHRIIISLEERGFIRRLPNRARAVEILKRVDDIVPTNAPKSMTDPAEHYNRDLMTNRDHMGHRGYTDNRDYMGLSTPAMGGRDGMYFESPQYQQHPPAQHPFKLPFMETAEIPMLGKIAAGTPIESISTPDYNVGFPMSMLSGAQQHYALQIEGDSMIEAGIHNGDTVLIEKCTTARDGDIVVALIDRQEATLKTILRHHSTVHLKPANRNYDTQVYDSQRVQIQGRLIGLLRTY